MEEERSSTGFGLERERSDAGFGLEQEKSGGGFEMEEEHSKHHQGDFDLYLTPYIKTQRERFLRGSVVKEPD